MESSVDPWDLSNVDPCVVSYRGSRDEVDLLYFMMIYLTLEVPVFLCYRVEERTKVDPKEKGYRERMKGFSTP